MAKQTFYDNLGILPKASEQEIKTAYRTLAKQYHPDLNPSPGAEVEFKKINRAYDVLSDPLKRADYDRSLQEESYLKKTQTKAAQTQAEPTKTAQTATGAKPTQAQYIAALFRVLLIAFTGAIIGAIISSVHYAGIDSQPGFSFLTIIPGIVIGFLVGAYIGGDLYFKVESFLGYGRLGRAYTASRTIVLSLGFGYFGAAIGSAIDQLNFNQLSGFTYGLTLLGIILGSTIGSDGDTFEKMRSSDGKFNLFYTALRGLEIGFLGAVLGLVIGLILKQTGFASAWPITTFSGFVLGDILGSIAPKNLAAYASYTSATVRSIIFVGGIAIAIVVGMLFGYLMGGGKIPGQ